jgi:hypothetical protein
MGCPHSHVHTHTPAHTGEIAAALKKAEIDPFALSYPRMSAAPGAPPKKTKSPLIDTNGKFIYIGISYTQFLYIARYIIS